MRRSNGVSRRFSIGGIIPANVRSALALGQTPEPIDPDVPNYLKNNKNIFGFRTDRSPDSAAAKFALRQPVK